MASNVEVVLGLNNVIAHMGNEKVLKNTMNDSACIPKAQYTQVTDGSAYAVNEFSVRDEVIVIVEPYQDSSYT